MSRFRVPRLSNPDIVIRLAQSPREVEAANWLVYRSYVNLYWPDDEAAFRANPYLSSPHRRVAVAMEKDRVIGTLSALIDSPAGVPSDAFHPEILRRYRQNGDRLAEMTSFAIDASVKHSANLTLFLIKFSLQYAFYYLETDRLIASCRPKHADFYENVLGFEKLTPPTPYRYAGDVACQLVTLDLFQAHLVLSHRHETDAYGENFYRFLFVDDHYSVRLPDPHLSRRPRERDWAEVARQRALPLAG